MDQGAGLEGGEHGFLNRESGLFGRTTKDMRSVLNDQEFWVRLEYAASRWLENSPDGDLRYFWVDGFIPDSATNSKRGLDVAGIAWVGDGSRVQHQYRFVTSIPQKLLHRRTRRFWIEKISFDPHQRSLQIVITGQKLITQPVKAE